MDPIRVFAKFRFLVAVVCALALIQGDTLAYASFSQQAPTTSKTNQPSKIPLISLIP
jgi:hypothetical protein